ncbi:extracellular solute-binding protein [Cohnella thailandensis]|uniref:Extracellular solute-binding protein n=1 Tax=Cohnella thailandensis TaxID=557557 RepID=A0A841SVE0_9BACL|nr:extracellular solute-binding protein [Cohnella thailandensis]MBB6634566.1 extracellular solute-binding protein [Cohnella thailandensis]MBP1972879.1 putative aldouronate transport system substrate-binding protein [Cohnella thailandensis]
MRKALPALLTVGLVASLLAGCSGGNNGNNSSASPSGANASASPADSGSGAPAETVKLTGLIVKHPLTQELSKMDWLTKAEERAGVKIEWQEISADWDQKKGALLAGGDIPDLIVGPNAITDADFAQFPGLFQDLTELIASNGPNVQAMFDEKPETKVIATQTDGKIYGLPKYQRYWPSTVSRQYINQKWLDNLGLQMPTNWDELYDVLVAFKEKDANGDGDANDEIPMDFAPVGTTGFGFFQPQVLLGSLGITLTDSSGQGYFAEDGKIKNFFVDDRYRQLVEFLNKCWEAGLINPEAFTQDYSKFQSVARGSGDKAKVGFSWGWEVTDRFGNTLAPQYASMSPLKASADSNVQLSYDYDFNTLNYGVNMIEMSAKTKNKDAAMRFINQLYDPVVSMQVLFGSIGTNIKDNGDGSYAVLPPTDANMDPGTWKWTSTWADNGPMYISDSLNLTLGTDMQSVGKQTEPLDAVMNAIDKENDVLPSMFIKYSKDDNNAMSLVNTNLMNLAMAKFSQWVTKGGIGKEWDAYVKNIQKIGLDGNLSIMQKYYDDYKSKN